MIYKNILKPLIDFSTSFIFLIFLIPLMLLISLILGFVNQGDVFFTQKRPGKNSRIFRLIKFKTMNDKRDATGHLLPDHERLTRAGKFIRSTSLDELPQLINVLQGDMSLIGPRPLLVRYLPRYSKEQARRHEVRPGITGWAQVNGRNALSWEEKLKLDVYYVDHVSIKLDMKILMMTIKKVLLREGVNSAPDKTMEEFKGTKE